MNYNDLYYPVKYSEDGASFKLKTPGYKKEELQIQLVGDNIIISGDSPDYRKFERSFLVDDNYDITQTKAKYENGVLIITIPKKTGTTIVIE